MEINDPLFTYTCSGDTTLCNDCPITSRLKVSTSNVTFTAPTTQLSAEAFKNYTSSKYYIGYDNSSMSFSFALQYELYSTDNFTSMASLLTDYMLDVTLNQVPLPVTEVVVEPVVIPDPCVQE